MRKKVKDLTPVADPEVVAEIGAKTMTGLQTFYRDTSVCQFPLEQYKRGLVIQETGYIDVSSIMSGLSATTRYHVLTNQSAEFKSSFAMYAATTLPKDSYFKVLDVFSTNLGNLVTLLHIDPSQVTYFATQTHPEEEALAIASREKFIAALHMRPSPALNDNYWLRRTAFPIGINDDGGLFFRFDYTPYPHLDPFYQPMSLWGRIISNCRRRKHKVAS